MWLESFAYIFFLFSVDAKASLVETRVFKASLVRVRIGGGWNQKFLDYEIETSSILRIGNPLVGWNQKFLDYEIETGEATEDAHRIALVGIKSFSITRLKHEWLETDAGLDKKLESKVSRLRD